MRIPWKVQIGLVACGYAIALGFAGGWPALWVLFPFRDDGCPVLAFLARAGTMLSVA